MSECLNVGTLWVPHAGCFAVKSSELLENKRVDLEKRKRVRKSLKRKGIDRETVRKLNAGTLRDHPGGSEVWQVKGLQRRIFRICGNGWTYRRFFGCVAGKGLREDGARK